MTYFSRFTGFKLKLIETSPAPCCFLGCSPDRQQCIMVKFTLKLEDNRVEKWSGYYIDYKRLKHELDKLKDPKPNVAASIATCCLGVRRSRYMQRAQSSQQHVAASHTVDQDTTVQRSAGGRLVLFECWYSRVGWIVQAATGIHH